MPDSRGVARCRDNVARSGWNATGTVSPGGLPYTYTTEAGCEPVVAGLQDITREASQALRRGREGGSR